MPLAVDRYELGPLQTNCYVVRSERGAPEAVVVDPGDDAATLRLELARMGARCAGILITHGHWDHLGGVAGGGAVVQPGVGGFAADASSPRAQLCQEWVARELDA